MLPTSERKRRLRILVVVSYYYPYIGGAENIIRRLAEGMVAQGHTVRVLTTHLPDTPLYEEINGVEVERVAVSPPGNRYLFAPQSVLPLLRLGYAYDLWHTASNTLTIPVYAVARLLRRPIVCTCYEVLGARWQQVEQHPFKRWLYRRVEQTIVGLPYDVLATTSNATMHDVGVSGSRAQEITTIYSGVDEVFFAKHLPATGVLRQQIGATAHDFVYVYTGRPGVTKGVDHLLEAAPLIQRQVPHAHLVLVMSEEPREQYMRYREQGAALAAHARISFVPPTHDRALLAQYLRDANCVVVPSLTEGFGLSTAEPCMLGVPVVATHVGSIPEVICGSHRLVTPASAQALADGVMAAVRNELDWVPCKSFTWDAMVTAYEALYRKLVV